MGIIKQLPPHEAQKIAAGEVVDRPAHIIKELIENALDAGSTAITIALKDGGKQGICIEDNGHGMSAEDARLAIARHSTSKIQSIDDLSTLRSFGFRGEALASITAVSITSVITKTVNDLHATELRIEGGVITSEAPCASPGGTRIEVENLFYNVPARKKFLRTTPTETRIITNLFHAFTLSHPGCHFKLVSEDNVVYNCGPVKKPHERMRHLISGVQEHDFLEIIADDQQMSTISGFISRPHVMRYDRNQLFLFVNNRWVKNHKLSNALLKGYQNLLPAGKYPAAGIFINLEPHEVDINIHPRKEEVAFAHPHRVETLVKHAVQKTLEAAVASMQRSQVVVRPAQKIETPYSSPYAAMNTAPTPPLPTSAVFENNTPESFEETPAFFVEPIAHIKDLQAPLSTMYNEHTISIQEERSYRLIGQLSATYILIEHDQGLMLIDAHAAHERVLFQEYTQLFGRHESIGLLFPPLIELTSQEIEDLQPYDELLEKQGIMIERFGPQKLMIVATPVGLQSIDYTDFLKTMIAWIHEFEHAEPEIMHQKLTHNLQAMMACKAAVKAGDQLSSSKMYEIIDCLFKCTNNLTCPHGRPTTWLMTMHDIEKKFKRRT